MEKRGIRILTSILFLLAMATAGQVCAEEKEGGGSFAQGGDYHAENFNPWFLSSEKNVKPITYCVRASKDYPGRTMLNGLVQEAIKKWQDFFGNYGLNDYFFLINRQNQLKKWHLVTQFQEMPCESDPEIQFLFDVNHPLLDIPREGPEAYIARAVRGPFDHETFRNKGVLWFAPFTNGYYDDGVKNIEHMILHELGHVFGFPHGSVAVMNENAANLVQSTRYVLPPENRAGVEIRDHAKFALDPLDQSVGEIESPLWPFRFDSKHPITFNYNSSCRLTQEQGWIPIVHFPGMEGFFQQADTLYNMAAGGVERDFIIQCMKVSIQRDDQDDYGTVIDANGFQVINQEIKLRLEFIGSLPDKEGYPDQKNIKTASFEIKGTFSRAQSSTWQFISLVTKETIGMMGQDDRKSLYYLGRGNPIEGRLESYDMFPLHVLPLDGTFYFGDIAVPALIDPTNQGPQLRLWIASGNDPVLKKDKYYKRFERWIFFSDPVIGGVFDAIFPDYMPHIGLTPEERQAFLDTRSDDTSSGWRFAPVAN